MIFSSNSSIVYLKRNSLEVYSSKNLNSAAKLEFPPNYEKDQEIKDLEKFEQLITNFLSKLNLQNKKAIVVLSSENLFEKTIPLADTTKESKEAQKFFEEVPFDPQKIAKKQIRTKNGLNLIAANKILYESIVHVLQKLQVEIKAVVPATMFGVVSSSLTKEDIKKLTSNSQLVNTSNLLAEKPQVKNDKEIVESPAENEPTGENKPKASKIVVAGVAFITVGLIIAAYLLYKQGYVDQYLNPEHTTSDQQENQEPALPDVQPEELEATGQAQTNSKETITIQILNGSGIAGQASDVQEALETLGFSQIEIGNAPNQSVTTTLITYAESVNAAVIDEISSELEEILTNVQSEQNTQSQDFDIVIITGQPG